MFQNRIQFPCIYSCRQLHRHGVGYAEMEWLASDPLAVSIVALSNNGVPIMMEDPINERPHFVIARDNLHTAVRSGRAFGCPVIGEGDVTCKVLSDNVTTLSILWATKYVMLVDRDAVSRWIDETYTVVGTNAESSQINIDGILRRILEETK